MSGVAVLGAGSWGTALANHLAGKGEDVVLWAHDPAIAEAITRERENPVYLPGVQLATSLRATADPVEAARGRRVL
ncbi:MAG TPA: 2-dehydropantoate 2-reductase N-terminal domain-containing protein, partial [Gemmatimonadales bacterium]|nr:2-dehydropantoate 2-reductase N-terminal domain-containing protein [Gemmatimonadales bacterium]